MCHGCRRARGTREDLYAEKARGVCLRAFPGVAELRFSASRVGACVLRHRRKTGSLTRATTAREVGGETHDHD